MKRGLAIDLPALRQFMSCYWMETADLVYGNLTTATYAFLEMEAPSLIRSLPGELEDIRAAGYLVRRPAPESDEERFWQQFGARWLTEGDADLIALLLARHQNYGDSLRN